MGQRAKGKKREKTYENKTLHVGSGLPGSFAFLYANGTAWVAPGMHAAQAVLKRTIREARV
jgi:hypothetical protein